MHHGSQARIHGVSDAAARSRRLRNFGDIATSAPAATAVARIDGFKSTRRDTRVVVGGADDQILEAAMNQLSLAGFEVIEGAVEAEILQPMPWSSAAVDRLTGLPGPERFAEFLDHALAARRRSGGLIAVLHVDLDHFKEMNETLGREAGDMILSQVADRLRRCVREGDFLARPANGEEDRSVARLGSDEFVVGLLDVDQAQGAARVVSRIFEALSEEFCIGERRVFMTACAGISVQPPDGEDARLLMRHAETALSFAKKRGRGSYQFYTGAMNTEVGRKLELEGRLRGALERNELSLHYQPLYESRTGQLVGVEALARWHQNGEQVLPPSEFIPLAEETGLIVPIGEWVLRTACEEAKSWFDAGLSPIQISVNLSSAQLKRADFARCVAEVLAETQFPAHLLQIELTESGVIAQDAETIDQLRRITRLGVSLAIDDFGTGYSALGYLRNFPVGVLKIDRSFVSRISDDAGDAAFVAALVAMARKLGLTVVAEGVETQEQLAFLREHACDYAQGFLFSPPVSGEKMRAVMAQALGAATKQARG